MYYFPVVHKLWNFLLLADTTQIHTFTTKKGKFSSTISGCFSSVFFSFLFFVLFSYSFSFIRLSLDFLFRVLFSFLLLFAVVTVKIYGKGHFSILIFCRFVFFLLLLCSFRLQPIFSYKRGARAIHFVYCQPISRVVFISFIFFSRCPFSSFLLLFSLTSTKKETATRSQTMSD